MITNEAEYQQAFKDYYAAKEAGNREEKVRLATLISDYENKAFPLPEITQEDFKQCMAEFQ
jgi:hypothetical protein